MVKISYTADVARKDMNEVLTLYTEEQKSEYEEGLEKILQAHFDNLSIIIKNATSRGCSSTTYIVYYCAYDEFLYRARTITPWVLNELINAGYEANFTKKSDKFDEWYKFCIRW